MRRAALAAGAGLAACEGLSCGSNGADASKGPRLGADDLRPYGKTGFLSSPVAFGAAYLYEPDLLAYALDRGLNFVDTAYDYGDGRSERAVGEAIAGRDRSRIFLVTKIPVASRRHRRTPDPDRTLERSLKLLGTDHVDGLLLHNTSVEAMGDPAIRDFLRRRIGEGTVRFAGVSFHEDLAGHVEAMLEDDLYTILLFCFGYLNAPGDLALVKRVADAGRAVSAMKTLMGAYPFRVEGHESVEWNKDAPERSNFPDLAYHRSALRYVLEREGIHNALITMKSYAQIDAYLEAARDEYCRADLRVLEGYREVYGREYCRIGCSACRGACPRGVAVGDILRFEVYARNYGRPEAARAAYADLPRMRRAGGCVDCEGPCVAACPHGLDVKSRLEGAHRLLSRHDDTLG